MDEQFLEDDVSFTDVYNDYLLAVLDESEDSDQDSNSDDEQIVGTDQDLILGEEVSIDKESDEVYNMQGSDNKETYFPPNQLALTLEVKHDSIVSPGGTTYWVPNVNESVMIGLGSQFPNIYAADVAYRKYAAAAGFDVRQSNKRKNKDGDVQTRYLLCSRQGFPDKKDYHSIHSVSGGPKRRNSNIKRSGCKACIKFSY